MHEEPNIIFESDECVVIDKPAGLLVHEDGRSTDPTVVSWFESRYPSSVGIGESQLGQHGRELARSGVVHRLDRETSGVLVLAKTPEAFAHLKAQFHDRLAQKEYRAFVYGAMKERWGTIDKQIGRSASDFRLRSAQKGARGMLRDAVTDWERLAIGAYEGEQFSYLKLVPKTGRTHQLRVHLKAIDRPIVGDTLYAPSHVERSNNVGLKRLALHAHSLALTFPNGTVERFSAPLPANFEEALQRIAVE